MRWTRHLWHEAVSWRRVTLEAAIFGGILSAIGLLVNIVRTDGIPLVADKEYEILVPCPEPLGEVFPLEPAELAEEGTLVVDAREAEEFSEWHWPDARNVPFDFLEPVSSETVAEMIRSKARRIAVYGDGEDPDSGRELARELAGRGARNVYYVPGGAPRLQEYGGGTP